MPQFSDRVAVVTGAGSGIGRATALAFARDGAAVIVAARDSTEGQDTVTQITAVGGEARFVRADVTAAADVAAMVAAAVTTYGRLDYACNNAGVLAGGALHEFPDETWDRLIATNLTGVFRCMKAELQQMLTQGSGSIVNVASVVGLVGLPRAGALSASKHGVVGLTKSAALEYAQSGVRINAICPGYTHTPMIEQVAGSPEGLVARGKLNPIGRLGRPEEIAAVVLWLCSDAASFVTGHALAADGGYVAG